MEEEEKKGFFQTLGVLLIGIFKTAKYDIIIYKQSSMAKKIMGRFK
jgi:hypothetical protein